MRYHDIVKGQLRVDEGWRNKPYRDTVGKLTVGCGRNLDDVGLRDDEIAYLLENDIRVAENDARTLFVDFEYLSDNRKAVLINMALNLGKTRLSGFQRVISAVGQGDWTGAAKEMLQSRWAAQVGQRAQRLANMMREG